MSLPGPTWLGFFLEHINFYTQGAASIVILLPLTALVAKGLNVAGRMKWNREAGCEVVPSFSEPQEK